ncbi:hypothetical protein NQ315_009191 [Exocentrus adspersus]|uniref:Thyroglobulin type-1 domain-containing protein n=1 Tax=Exocentrus adspersus TaxID=1586481 RepID=A0AAV8WHZ7_9CUCU|nr:hypothetical protein NQ315_009191 [Exocentrus adspersus]
MRLLVVCPFAKNIKTVMALLEQNVRVLQDTYVTIDAVEQDNALNSVSVANSEVRCTTNADCPKTGRSVCTEMCIADLNSCMAYYANTTDFRYNKFTALKFKPVCEIDSTWKAKQCKGGVSGRCYCFDKNGKRLFGQAPFLKSDDMTCECSRKKAELLEAGETYVSFHCDSKGNFEKLQCNSGLCWCVEPKTGELNSTVVPERAITKLPCYSAAEVGSQYLRQCDSAKYGMSKIYETLRIHGVQYANLGTLLCDGDGAYGAYNINAGIAYCTWRDGKKIGTWQSDTSTDVSTLNCNCARDYQMYSHILQCDGSGNYKTLQSVVSDEATIYYCVDSDGFAKSDVSATRIDNCDEYY